jgi:predicted nucleic acid-binding protein
VKQVIIDTGPLVALIDATDTHHKWSSDQLRKLNDPLLTCDAVLSETCFLLRAHPTAFRHLQAFLDGGTIVSHFKNHPHAPHLFGLMDTYQNLPMSFADACLVCLAEDNPGSIVFTTDSHFTIYRQQRRRLIPLIAPFA